MNDQIIERKWTTKAGLRAVCLIVLFSGRKNHRCGYVEVPKGHPYFGAEYDAVSVDVHGGLTYSSAAFGADKDDPRDGDGWWFGFDCAHAGDGNIEDDPRWPRPDRGPARSQEYVEQECESLAAQLAAKEATP